MLNNNIVIKKRENVVYTKYSTHTVQYIKEEKIYVYTVYNTVI